MLVFLLSYSIFEMTNKIIFSFLHKHTLNTSYVNACNQFNFVVRENLKQISMEWFSMCSLSASEILNRFFASYYSFLKMSSVLSHSFKLQGFLLCIPSHSTLKFQVFVVTPLALHAIQRLLEVARFLYRRITSLVHPYLISKTLYPPFFYSATFFPCSKASPWEFREVLQRH